MQSRVSTGIEGLDQILDGGFVRNKSVLIAGGPGTGKTLMALNFLYDGASRFGEKGLYLSLENNVKDVMSDVKATFTDLEWNRYLHKDILAVKLPKKDYGKLSDVVKKAVREGGIKRVVIDSVTMLKIYASNHAEFRTNLLSMIESFRSLDCTIMLISEKPYSQREDNRFSVEEFVSDGVILLYNIPKGELRYRALEVIKMRGVKHTTKLCPYMITPSGIKVFPIESTFWIASEQDKRFTLRANSVEPKKGGLFGKRG